MIVAVTHNGAGGPHRPRPELGRQGHLSTNRHVPLSPAAARLTGRKPPSIYLRIHRSTSPRVNEDPRPIRSTLFRAGPRPAPRSRANRKPLEKRLAATPTAGAAGSSRRRAPRSPRV